MFVVFFFFVLNNLCIKFELNASSRASPATYPFALKPRNCVLFIYLGGGGGGGGSTEG